MTFAPRRAARKAAALFLCLALAAAAFGCRRASPKKPAPPPTVALAQTSLSLLTGESQPLTASVTPADARNVTIQWSSDNAAVANVDESGTVTAVAPGTCRITCSVGTASSAACAVTVEEASDKTTVLMYHSIITVAGNKLCIPPQDFETEIKWLADNGFHALTLDELYDHMTGMKKFPKKSVVITLDDGYDDNYSNAFPILKKYNMHATVFMITSLIDKPRYMTADNLKEMSDSGLVSIQCHTVTHPYLDQIMAAQQTKELTDSKQTLEALLGKPVDYLAYPSGHYNKNSISIAKSLGYKMCFIMDGGTGGLSSDCYTFPRAFVDKNLATLINAANGLAKD